jgi:protein-tyrosine phosphatase
MFDIHTHLIPGVDDGSPDLETTLAHLHLIQDACVTAVVFTSHYMRGAYLNTRDALQTRFDELCQVALEQGITLKFYQGAEVFLVPGVENDVSEFGLNIDNTPYVLVETDLNHFSSDLYENLYQLLRNGFRPILAHAERYQAVIAHFHTAEEMIRRNVYIQVNAASLLGGYGSKVKKTAWFLLEQGWAHFVASDDHCRNPMYNLAMARNAIAQRIDEYTADLLTNKNPHRLLSSQEIPYEYVNFQVEKERHGRRNFWQRLFG